jgi:hypothetical protein
MSNIKDLISSKRAPCLAAAFPLLVVVSLLLFPTTAFAAGRQDFSKNEGLSPHLSQPHPNDPPDDLCIQVNMSVLNSSPGTLSITIGLQNNCGAAITSVRWDYTTDIICQGNVEGGPINRGFGPDIAAGDTTIVASDRWTGISCPESYLVDWWGDGYGIRVSDSSSVTGHAQGSRLAR